MLFRIDVVDGAEVADTLLGRDGVAALAIRWRAMCS
jgi:hypothetical protein